MYFFFSTKTVRVKQFTFLFNYNGKVQSTTIIMTPPPPPTIQIAMLNILHIVIVTYVLVVPFFPAKLNMAPAFLVHVGMTLSMIVHWMFNDDTCCLTVMESALRGVPKQTSFMHRLVSPFYNVNEDIVGNVTTVLTFALLFISLVKLRHVGHVFYPYLKSLKKEEENKEKIN